MTDTSRKLSGVRALPRRATTTAEQRVEEAKRHDQGEGSQDADERVSMLDLKDVLSELGDALDKAGVARKSG